MTYFFELPLRRCPARRPGPQRMGPWWLACLVAAFFLSAPARAQQPAYRWDNVVIGGGGYVTGVLVHPTEADLVYMRTDIGGLFRWDKAQGRWHPLSGWIPATAANLFGVDGFALDANNPDVIYATFGKYPTQAGGIYKSVNRGESWTKLYDTPFAANLNYRWLGENLAVDPHNSAVVYCGTRTAGLLRSLDAGAHWSPVASVPAGIVGDAKDYWATNPVGVRTVAVDGAGPVAGRSSTVYVGVYQTGVYRSQDGGDGFALLPGSPADVHRLAPAPGGLLYATTGDGVYQYDGAAWQKLPVNPTGYADFNALAVDPLNAQHLLVSTGVQAWWQKQYRSADGGTTWQELSPFNGTMAVHDQTWHAGELGFFQAATSCAAFDPHHAGRVYMGDWYQVWRCDNLWAGGATAWYNDVLGHEEVVPLTLCTPPAGAPLLSGQGDVVGFRHPNLQALPAIRLTPKAEGTGLDYCESNPAYLALVSADDWYGLNTQILVSADSGKTFSARGIPADSRNGKIACASHDVNQLVYVRGGNAPYYSTDRGANWKPATGAPATALATTYMYQWNEPLMADRGAGNAFYLMDWASGRLYRSADGGATWAPTNAAALPAIGGTVNRCNLATGFGGADGLLGVSLEREGLWLSSDRGATFAKDPYFATALLFALGKEKPGTATPTAYVYGAHEQQWGIYRSDNLGGSWVRINDDQHYIGNEPTVMKADRQVYGRVYVGTNGSGLFYGEAAAGSPTPTPTPPPTSSLRAPENPAGAVAGLDYAYYQGSWDKLPDFAALTAAKTGTVTGFDLSPRTQDDNFAFQYRGYVDVPADGQYTFYTSSDDGSRLYIGSTLVVDNDGLHGATEKSGTIGLQKGQHALTVAFFERGDGQELYVSYSSASLSKTLIPASALFRDGGGSTPAPTPAPTASMSDYEAEQGTYGGGSGVQDAGNASGGQLVGNLNAEGAYSQVSGVAGRSGGTATVAVRYANGYADNRSLSLYVNGSFVQRLTFKPTGGWNTFSTVSAGVSLSAGTGNTLKLQREAADLAAADVDKYTVTTGAGAAAALAGPAAAAALVGELRVFPNPSAPGQAATLRYELRQAAPVSWTLYDGLGRQVRVSAGGPGRAAVQAAGRHEQTLPVSGLAPGLYALRLVAGTQTLVRQMCVR